MLTKEYKPNDRCWSLYRHISPEGKIYVGITSAPPKERWAKGYKDNRKLQEAIRKYGFNNFEHEVMMTNLTKEAAIRKEIEFISLYKSYGISYNIDNGGFCAGKRSDETREILRQKAIGHKRNLGSHRTIEQRKRMSEAQIGKKHTEETKRKISEINKGNTNRRLPLYQYDLKGNFIRKYNTTYEAQEATGANRCNISACCNGRLNKAGGYRWSHKPLNT